MMEQSFAVTLLLSPVTWIMVLLAWCLVFLRTSKIPPVYNEFDKNRNHIGDFIKKGNSQDSDAEKRVRPTLERAGYALMPMHTGLVVGAHFGEEGSPVRPLTPDIIIYAHHGKPCKIIVEYDGAKFHGFDQRGNPNLAEMCKDAERNQRFSEAGYTVVRIRGGEKYFDHAPNLDGTLEPARYAILTPGNDVCLTEDFEDDKHRSQVLDAVRNARYRPVKYWDELVCGLYPYVERENKVKAAQREMEAKLHAQGL